MKCPYMVYGIWWCLILHDGFLCLIEVVEETELANEKEYYDDIGNEVNDLQTTAGMIVYLICAHITAGNYSFHTSVE